MRAVNSGKVAARFGDFGQTDVGMSQSPDRRFLMLRDSDEFDEQRAEIMARLVRLDLETQSMSRWRVPRATIGDRSVMELSPGGRFCILRGANPKAPALIWDLAQDRITMLTLLLHDGIVFSADGRFVAGDSNAEPGRIHVIDLGSPSSMQILVGPDYPRWNGSGTPPFALLQIQMSVDGSFLAAQFYASATGHEVFCWNAVNGQLFLRCPGDLIGFASAGFELVTEPWRGRLEVHDLPTGVVSRAFSVNDGNNCFLSRDGRTVVAPTERPNFSILALWAGRFGLPWPFDKSNNHIHCRIYDLSTGGQFGEFVTNNLTNYGRTVFFQSTTKQILDGRLVSLEGNTSLSWCVWDMPPRKSPREFAIYAALLAAVIALIAWRIQHRLKLKLSAVT